MQAQSRQTYNVETNEEAPPESVDQDARRRSPAPVRQPCKDDTRPSSARKAEAGAVSGACQLLSSHIGACACLACCSPEACHDGNPACALKRLGWYLLQDLLRLSARILVLCPTFVVMRDRLRRRLCGSRSGVWPCTLERECPQDASSLV